MIKKISLLLTLLISNTALAGTIFTPGTSKNPSSSGYTLSDNSFIAVNFESGRSYCCDFHARSSEFINTIDTNVYDSSLTNVIGTAANRTTTTPSNVSGASPFKRMCLFSTANNIHGFKFTDIAGNGGASTIQVHTHCVETSLYGGYNTNAARYNFLEVLNTTNSTINFKITAQNFDGTTVINNTSHSILPGRRLDVDIHSASGLGKYGLIKITHDGPFGALQAGVSFYKADFTQTAHVPLKTREQVQ